MYIPEERRLGLPDRSHGNTRHKFSTNFILSWKGGPKKVNIDAIINDFGYLNFETRKISFVLQIWNEPNKGQTDF